MQYICSVFAVHLQSAACAKAWERGVHERIVSVRPCLKAAVEADS